MVKERLLKFMELEKVSAARFAEILDVQPSAISHILSGRNKPSFDLIEKIITKFPRLNVDWLITGKGNMYKVAVQQSLFDEIHQPPPKTETIKPKVDENSESKMEYEMFTVVNRQGRLKTVNKIIILYTDNTFDIYTQG